MAKKESMSFKTKRRIVDGFIYALLVVISIIWLIPIVYTVFTAFRKESGLVTSLWPRDGLTFDNFIKLFVGPEAEDYPYLRWVGNTLLVSICTMLISTLFVLSVAYTMSRLRFKGRKTLMSLNLILGMFPGFMALAAIYSIIKLLNLSGTLGALIICYSASAGMGFYIAKGFFDTIPKSMDEAARIDGATNFVIFWKIILPLSKPIIVYTLLTSFMGPWVDFILSSLIVGTVKTNWTVAYGLYNMINFGGDPGAAAKYMTMFFAGAVLISVPITALFLATQKYYVSGVTGGAVKG